MEFFLNEWSLQSQFTVVEEFAQAAVDIVALIVRAREITRGRSMLYRSERLAHRSAIGTDPFQKSIYALSKEIREALLDVVYNKSAPAPWEVSRLSESSDLYQWVRSATELVADSTPAQSETAGSAQELLASTAESVGQPAGANDRDVSDTSMSELAERLMCEAIPTGCLLNFFDSELTGVETVDIVKNGAPRPASVASFETVAAFEKWLNNFRGAKPYDSATDTDPPIDEQTCLVDTTRFEPTSRPKQQGRTLYEHRTTRDTYYVDNLHWGGGAHLEVFSRMGKHRGEASLDGKLKENTRDKTKDYTLD